MYNPASEKALLSPCANLVKVTPLPISSRDAPPFLPQCGFLIYLIAGAYAKIAPAAASCVNAKALSFNVASSSTINCPVEPQIRLSLVISLPKAYLLAAPTSFSANRMNLSI